jgi:hypothetical protein
MSLTSSSAVLSAAADFAAADTASSCRRNSMCWKMKP